jgi:protein-disulfide isomerase
MTPSATGSNGGKRKPPKDDGSNARERARIAAEATARQKKRRTLAVVVLAVVVLVAAAGIGIGYATNFGKPRAHSANGDGWGPVKITNGDPIVLGDDNAPVTLTLYEDFRCPHCANFENTLGKTITDLQKAGKVKVGLYVLTIIDNEDGQQGSLRSGNAMACAAEEGFGEAYYNALYDNYGKAWTNEQLVDLAKQVGDPSAGFASCVSGLKHQDWLNSAAQAANQNQVSGTPTVFINDTVRPDAAGWTPQQLRDAVNQAAQQ